MGILEKIKEIEFEMARTQKNKATNYHLGTLKAKLAKLRSELLQPKAAAGASTGNEGFEVSKSGDGRVALIGFPSVGKSTLLSKLTPTESLAAGYEFTTLTCIPGNIEYNGCKIQLLDLPGIIEGAAYGKGRGRQVIAVAKTSDLVIMVLDAAKEREKNHRQILEKELETVGLRLNKQPPNIYFKPKKGGGVSFNSTCPLTKLGPDPREAVRKILHEYKIHNAEVLFREDYDVDALIDVIEGNRKYIRCLYVYNKIDTISMEEVDRLARMPNSMVMSVHMDLNLDYLLKRMWDTMGLVRVYTKKKGQAPDFSDPVVVSTARTKGTTVEFVCRQVHRQLVDDFNFAMVWGTSTKHDPMRCGINHVLQDEDVLQVVKRTSNQDRHDSKYAERCQASFDAYHAKKKKKSLKS